MKKVIFTIASRRLEVELEEEFAKYLSIDLAKNDVSLDQDNDISQLLQLYLKSLHQELRSEKQIKIILNHMEGSI